MLGFKGSYSIYIYICINGLNTRGGGNVYPSGLNCTVLIKSEEAWVIMMLAVDGAVCLCRFANINSNNNEIRDVQ
jgi:hypothetical protein